MQQQSPIMPTKVITQPVVRQTVIAQPTTTYTESQINDFVSKCRTFLTTLLRLAEKQAPEKLPMVRTCIQELLVYHFKRNQAISNPSSSLGWYNRSRIIHSTTTHLVQITTTYLSGSILQGKNSLTFSFSWKI